MRPGGASRIRLIASTAAVCCAAGLAGAGGPGGGSRVLAQPAPAPAILPLAQVRPGMTGYGLTVIHGTTIERFNVKILGILKGGPGSDLILFRASGPVAMAAGGTASGMSGSPIYVSGRLAGALSYGYHFAGPDADLSLATPIEEMLKVLAPADAAAVSPRPRVYEAAAPIPAPSGPVQRVVIMDSPTDALAYNSHPLPRTVAASPVAVPMVAWGVTPQGLTLLTRMFHRFNIVPRQGYGGHREFAAPPMEPGGSLGVDLVRGDVEVGAIGAVTYRRGNTILAFGHPLLNAGTVSMLMASAWIDTVVRALDFPFKEGSTGSLLGGVTQDRSVGLAGTLGRLPRMFGVRVRVRDEERGISRVFGAQVIRRPDLAEGLVPATVLSLVQKALDRVAGGSAAVRITLRARGLPRKVVREDLTYDMGDIGTAAVLDVPAASQLLFGNFFQTLDPVDLSLDVVVTSRPKTALLVEARPSTRTVSPGDRLTVAVTIKPFGESRERSKAVEVTVPKDFPPGGAFLLVGTVGALNSPIAQPPGQQLQQLVLAEGTPPSSRSLDDLIDEFEHGGKNTDVLVALVPEATLTAITSNANPDIEVPVGRTVDTPWVVLGRFQIPMTVKGGP